MISRHHENPRSCRVRRRKEARPGELLSAALEIFVEKGFAAAKLEDVAEAAGVSKGTIYLYFESKEALFRAVVREGVALALDAIEAQAAALAKTDRPVVALLRGYCHTWQRIMRDTTMASLLRLLAAEAGNFPDVVEWFSDAIVRPARRALADIVAVGIEDGDFRSIPAEIAADMFLALIWQCAFNAAWRGSTSPEHFLDEAFEVLVRGVAGNPAQ